MTGDPRTKAAVDELWARTAAHPEDGLTTLFETVSRRRRQSRLRLATATAVAVLAAWWGFTTFGDVSATPPAPMHPSVPTRPSPGPCHTLYVTCLGDRTYRFGLYRPVDWHIPDGYGVNSGDGANIRLVESYGLGSRSGSGVTVLERARPASQSGSLAPGVPDTASGFVHWLASRPFLEATTPRQTTIDGRSAWQVRVQLKPHLGPGPQWCNTTQPCYPITHQEFVTDQGSTGLQSAITGIWGDMTADYTAFDLSGGPTTQQKGPTVVWSWAFGHDTAALDRNHALVDGLSWPAD